MARIGCVTGLGFGLLSVLSCGPATADPLPCREAAHEGSRYTVCEVDLRRQAVKLFWRKSDGAPYRYLNSVPRTLEADAPMREAMRIKRERLRAKRAAKQRR
jgi:uncharacterized protein YigE (DUF2233 family)